MNSAGDAKILTSLALIRFTLLRRCLVLIVCYVTASVGSPYATEPTIRSTVRLRFSKGNGRLTLGNLLPSKVIQYSDFAFFLVYQNIYRRAVKRRV